MAVAPHALVIAADGPVRAMLHFLLHDAGCRVTEIAGSIVDPALLRADPPVLVAFVVGQRDDSLHLVSSVRQQCPAARLLVFGRSITMDLRRRVLALGAHHVAGLPIAADDLQRRLYEALGDAALARRGAEPAQIRAGGLILRRPARTIADEYGWTAYLTSHEATLLAALMASPGRPVAHSKLADAVWPDGVRDEHNALAALVRRLRAKLVPYAGAPDYLHTVRGHGYLFEARATPRAHETLPDADRPILVIDDDEATVRCVGEVLGDAGYTVTWGSGVQAPALARQTQPRLVLLDIHMPGVNGVDVCQQLRAHPHTAGIPIIAFSAGYNLRANLSRLAADDYLNKPFDADELLIRVEKWGGVATYSRLA